MVENTIGNTFTDSYRTRTRQKQNQETQKKTNQNNQENTEKACEIINLRDIQNFSQDSYGLYPTVGESLDYLNTINFKIEFLYRKLDQFSWQYCNKGFFNFKNYIPKIITTFN